MIKTKSRIKIEKAKHYAPSYIYIYDNNHCILAIDRDKKNGGLVLPHIGSYRGKYHYDLSKIDKLQIIGVDLVL